MVGVQYLSAVVARGPEFPGLMMGFSNEVCAGVWRVRIVYPHLMLFITNSVKHGESIGVAFSGKPSTLEFDHLEKFVARSNSEGFGMLIFIGPSSLGATNSLVLGSACLAHNTVSKDDRPLNPADGAQM